MHAAGISAEVDHIRDGQVIRTLKAEYFEFDQQGAHVARAPPFEFQPGDTFHTRCTYDTDEDRIFGYGSQDEMCQIYVVYYPAKSILGLYPWSCVFGVDDLLPQCNSDWTSKGSTIADFPQDEESRARVSDTTTSRDFKFGVETTGTCQVDEPALSHGVVLETVFTTMLTLIALF